MAPPPLPLPRSRPALRLTASSESCRSAGASPSGSPGTQSSDISPNSATLLRPAGPPASASPPGAQPAYYLPPPGYARSGGRKPAAAPPSPSPSPQHEEGKDPRGSADDAASPQPERSGVYFPPQAYGGSGSWRQKRDGNWEWIETVGELIEETIVPVLRHSDWSLPQAKQILSSWATLATLLAGTQTSLLNYTSERAASDSSTAGIVLALFYGGIMLEIWGAILAISLIIASITLQAPEAANRINSAPGTNGGPALGPLGTPRFASVHTDGGGGGGGSSLLLAARPASGLSTTALTVLDRLTYACGIIVPSGGVLGFVAFSFFALGQVHVSPTAWHGAVGLGAALLFCVGTTTAALLGGCVSARRRLRRQRQRSPEAVLHRHRGERGTAEDEEKLLEHGAAAELVVG